MKGKKKLLKILSNLYRYEYKNVYLNLLNIFFIKIYKLIILKKGTPIYKKLYSFFFNYSFIIIILKWNLLLYI